MTKALANLNVNAITLDFDAGDIYIPRLVNLDLNGHMAGKITYSSDVSGEVSVLNSSTPTTINSLIVTAPNATFNLDSGITLNGKTIVNNVAAGTFNTKVQHNDKVKLKDSDNRITLSDAPIINSVAVGTFNTKAQHNGKVEVKDPDGGSINFTGATINDGIEISPEIAATEAVIIRGDAPTAFATGNANIKVLGSSPKVILEGVANDILIEAPNSEFNLSAEGDASNITIDEAAKGSKITTSKKYQFELLFTEGQMVSNMTSSGLFGDQEIRVVGYPSEEENINIAYLLKLDGDVFSNVYTFENYTFGEEECVVTEDGSGKFRVSKEEMKIYLEGNVTGKELRKYLEDQSQNIFEVAEDKVIISFYDVKTSDVELIESETFVDNKLLGMRVLVGTNEQHGLYTLTKKSVE